MLKYALLLHIVQVMDNQSSHNLKLHTVKVDRRLHEALNRDLHEVGIVYEFYPFAYLEGIASREAISHIFELGHCSRPNVDVVILTLHGHR